MVVGLEHEKYTVLEGESVRICARMRAGAISEPLVVVIETGYSPLLITSECG